MEFNPALSNIINQVGLDAHGGKRELTKPKTKM